MGEGVQWARVLGLSSDRIPQFLLSVLSHLLSLAPTAKRWHFHSKPCTASDLVGVYLGHNYS